MRRFHNPRGAGFQARNADILVGASARAPILVAAMPLCITPTQFLRTLRRFRGSRSARTRACRVDTRVDAWRISLLVPALLLRGAGAFACQPISHAFTAAGRGRKAFERARNPPALPRICPAVPPLDREGNRTGGNREP